MWVLVGRNGQNDVSWCTCFWSIVQIILQGIWTHLHAYKPEYSDDCDYGILLDTEVVTAAISSQSYVYGSKFSTVSSFFNFCSLGDTPSRVYPYKLNGTYFMNASRIFQVP